MSLDRSLKIKGALTRHRNVLSRAERIEKLAEEQRWLPEGSIFGLPKVAHRKSHAGAKAAKEKPAAGVTPEGGVAPAGTEPAPASPTAAKPSAKAGPQPAPKAASKTAPEKPRKK
jgi:small basic protein (TIGR04137 family)